MSRKKAPEKEANHERWLITYADLITLLLVFFIVLYAGSQDDSRKFAILAQGLRSAFHNVADNGAGGNSPIFTGTGSSQAGGSQQEVQDFQSISAVLERFAQDHNLAKQVGIRLQSDGIAVSLTGDLLFAPGDARLRPTAGPVLDAVAAALKDKPNILRTEGHTDDIPLVGSPFDSNWELSTARATAVLRYLVDSDHLPPSRLYAAGFADTHAIADNKTAAGRQANRRAEVVVLYPPQDGRAISDDPGRGPR